MRPLPTPIGKAAMTGAAERTRRYRERFRHDEPVTKQARPDAALARELAQAKTELAQVKARIAELQQIVAQKRPATKHHHVDTLEIDAEVRRRIAAANDFTREENKRLRQEVHSLTRIINQRGVFTEKQYRQMQILCHPDNSASPQLKAELSQVLVENKIRLIKAGK
jgi:hypothetical protein